MSDERDRVLIGRTGDRVFVEHTRTGARLDLSVRMARAVLEALAQFTDDAPGVHRG